jgi:hypothetical protein
MVLYAKRILKLMVVAPAALLESEAAAKAAAAAAAAMDVEDGEQQQGDNEAAAAAATTTTTTTTTTDSDRFAPGLNLVYIFPVHTMASTSIHRNFQTTNHNSINSETSEPISRRE